MLMYLDNVVARIGNMFLVVDRPITDANPDPNARVVNLNRGNAIVMSTQSALKLGYWEETTAKELTPEEKEGITRYYNIVRGKDVLSQIKETITNSSRYNVYRDNKIVGVLTFGSVPALEISSQDPELLKLITAAMVNSLEVEDGEGGTIYAVIGDFLYQDAVLQHLKNNDYTYGER